MNIAEIYEEPLPAGEVEEAPPLDRGGIRQLGAPPRAAEVGFSARSRTSIPTTCRGGWTGSIVPAPPKAYKCLRQIVRWWIRAKRLHIPDPTLYVRAAGEGAVPSRRAGRGRCHGHAARHVGPCHGGAAAICSVTMGARRASVRAHGGDINLKNRRGSREQVAAVRGRKVVTEGPRKPTSPTRSCYLPRFAINRLRQIRGKGLITGDVSPDKVALDQVVVQTHAPAARQHDQSAPYLGDARYRGRHRHPGRSL